MKDYGQVEHKPMSDDERERLTEGTWRKCICPGFSSARDCLRERYHYSEDDAEKWPEDMCECECHSQDEDEPEDRLPPGC